jgi:cytochrome P450
VNTTRFIGHRADSGLVTRYDDVLMVMRDRRFGRGRSAETIRRGWGEGAAAKYILLRLSGYNPPDHTRLRSLATKAFTGKRVESMRPHILLIAEQLLDEICGASTFDIVKTLTHSLPSLVICEMLGVPETDRPRFAPWTEAIARALAPAVKPAWLEDVNRAAGEFMEYIRALVVKRRSAPSDDLLCALIAAEEGGGRLSEDELVATVLFLFTAGHQTTRDLTGNGLVALFQHPEQLRRLRADLALIPDAVEECLRYDPPVMRVPAKCLEETSLGNRTFAAGDEIYAALSAANRDPARFPEPDRFDIDSRRQRAPCVRRRNPLLPRGEPRARRGCNHLRDPVSALSDSRACRRANRMARLAEFPRPARTPFARLV